MTAGHFALRAQRFSSSADVERRFANKAILMPSVGAETYAKIRNFGQVEATLIQNSAKSDPNFRILDLVQESCNKQIWPIKIHPLVRRVRES